MIRILQGDARDVLKTLSDASVQCCVTSPPYHGLRSYLPVDHPDKRLEVGCEPTIPEYIEALIGTFGEIRRLLNPTGVVWLNIGDVYRDGQRVLLPAKSALALQDDGWLLIDEVIWHKPRTTPFPMKRRTVPAHEMVYMLAKQSDYFFDWEAIEEPSAYPGLVRSAGSAFRDLAKQDPIAARKRPSADRQIVTRDTRRKRSVWSVSPSPHGEGHFATMAPEIAETCVLAGSRQGDTILDPFGGAGTTALVADRLGRNAILIELNQQYCDLARNRLTKDAGLFAEVSA